MISRINTFFIKLFDVPYLLKFVLRLMALYILFRLINWFMIGAIVPGGFYSSFIDNYLNYVTLIKVTVLQTASLLAQLFGIASYAVDNSTLQIVGSNQLFMAWSCCGLEIMSIWAAFSLADSTSRRTKILWCVGGIFCIWFINCIRVVLLMIAIKNQWQEIPTLKHHDTFNIAAYALVLLMMFIYYKKNIKHLGQ